MNPRSQVALVLSALYLAIVFVLPASLFWSPDEGAKYLQLTSYHGHWPRLHQRVEYGGRQLDPKYRFYPQPLPMHHRFELISRLFPRPADDGGVQTNWSPLFSLLSMPLFRFLGFHGLYLLPVAAGIGSALLAGRLARRVVPQAEVPVILAVGLCSPVLIYSCLFWEHTLAVCLGMAAVVLCAVKPPLSPVAALAAAACLAIAIALRLELVVFAGALTVSVIAAAVRDRSAASGAASRRAFRSVTTALAAALGGMGLAVAWVAVRKIQLWGVLGAKEGSLAQLLVGLLTSPRLWQELPIRLQRALIDLPADNGPTLDPWIAWLGLLGVLVAVASLALREPARGWTLVAGGGLLTLVSLWAVMSPDRFRCVHALLLPAPYVVFVVLLFVPLPIGGDARWILASTTAIVIVSSVVLSLPLLVGGLEWGNRYQLIAYVLAAVGCATGTSSYARFGEPWWPRRAVAVAAGLALAVGGLYQVRGLHELAVTKADLRSYRKVLTTASEPVVTDLYWIPTALAETFRRLPIFTLRDPDELADWIDAVGARERRFLVVTDEAPPAGVERWRTGAKPHAVELIGEQSVAGIWFFDLQLRPARQAGPS